MSIAGKTFLAILLIFVPVNLAVIALVVSRYPALFTQPGAYSLVFEPVFVLLVYAVLGAWMLRSRNPQKSLVLKTALFFGIPGGVFELVNISIEGGFPFSVRSPLFPIGGMLILFTSWAAAAFFAARSLASFRAGLLAAVSAAATCMLLGAAFGFAIELFLLPPNPAEVTAWAEFKRSGWTDPHAFAIANTLDSAFTHLVIAPLIALFLGSLVSFAALRPRAVKPSTLGKP